MATDVNITIIGSGVVGLAIASHLSLNNDNIFVIERHRNFGQETSSRNSEVIHSGKYYPSGTLKAKLCVEGREMLYELCERENIAYKKCGKLIVATNELEIEQLHKIMQQAKANNVNDLSLLEKDQIFEMEPNVSAIKAIYSPSTGIIDSHGLMKYFEGNAIKNGVDFSYLSNVNSISKDKNNAGYVIQVNDTKGENFSFSSGIVINSAGLESDKIARMVGIIEPDYKIYFCKGEYFSINPPKNRLVSRLIYPVPFKKLTGLGVHATIDLGGGLKLGPNTIYLDENIYDYKVDDSHLNEFYNSAKKYFPFLEKSDLSPDQAGIRAKLQAPGKALKDFVIREESDKGFPGFINLIGIESPGLTSAMAIAKYVSTLIPQ